MTEDVTQDRCEALPDDAPHVLIVDDDHRIRELVQRFLQNNGFRVTAAGDAEGARSAMRGLSFDLVILDVMMPGESGLELARSLKAISPVPICMMTALADPKQRVAGLEAGVDDYVVKPFDPREMLLRLQNILRLSLIHISFANLTGNGCHAHVSLWSKERSLFEDPSGELGLTPLGYQFIGGLIHNADALAAITNPTVNSYKRINAPRTISGATWSPNTVTYAGNNRTHMIRIPDTGRFEFRLADGATNPYLLPAGLLASGLDGIRNRRDPGKRLDIDMYAEGHLAKDAKKLPLNLLDALRRLEGSSVLRSALGEATVTSYLKMKHAEWNDYARHLTEWERDTTLDC